MTDTTPIAVVGMGVTFPGANDLETFWRNIAGGRVAMGSIPANRWVMPAEAVLAGSPQPDRALTRIGGLVTDLPPLPEDLPYDSRLLAGLDPLYPVVVHAGLKAYAACRNEPLDPDRVGVVLAAIALPTEASSRLAARMVMPSLSDRLFGTDSEERPLTPENALAARVTGLPGAVLAQALGVGGGSLTLDAACASSLYAVKLACDALIEGRADAMLAGGVSRPDCLYTQIGFSQLRALSPSGACAPFDRRADGLVVGEGAGIVVLKRLEDALSHGDDVWGVIRGIGLSNDIQGNLLAPSDEGQLRAMRNAYRQAGWHPRTIRLIECHGAGTPVGDAVELKSLRALWGRRDWRAGQCTLGSVKSNIGHLLTAAGAAGMIKTLLAMRHGILPPTARFHAYGDPEMAAGPFRVLSEAAAWPAEDAPRRAAVSGFGFGGINAHLLFESYSVGPAPDDAGISIPDPDTRDRGTAGLRTATAAPEPIAVVGMAASIGALPSLEEFSAAVMGPETSLQPSPPLRWGLVGDSSGHLPPGLSGMTGGFCGDLAMDLGPFRLPPKEAPDVLTQQLLMLEVAASALRDAGWRRDGALPMHAAVMGIDFDFEATDFTLRWHLDRQVQRWQEQGMMAAGLPRPLLAAWIEELKDAVSPPLTPSRTLGALGSIVASRIAREFRFGGPSFTVSAGAASGLKALEIAAGMLRRKEIEVALVGAVDLAGDLRRVALDWVSGTGGLNGNSDQKSDRADWHPGEGAAAVVLKPLSMALSDGDRIYALVSGTGSATASNGDDRASRATGYARSLKSCLGQAPADQRQVALIECQGPVSASSKTAEAEALGQVFPPPGPLVTSLAPQVGHCGAVSGLASLIRMALSLHQGRYPATAHHLETGLRPSPAAAPPRTGCVAAATRYGETTHVLLAAPPAGSRNATTDSRPSPDTGVRRSGLMFHRRIGERPMVLPPPVVAADIDPSTAAPDALPHREPPAGIVDPAAGRNPHTAAEPIPGPPAFTHPEPPSEINPAVRLIQTARQQATATAAAHKDFLDLSQRLSQQLQQAVSLKVRLAGNDKTTGLSRPEPSAPVPQLSTAPLFDRRACMEFAVGSAERVLGPEFAVVDTYPVRVRLPDTPLMLVDRILTVEGRKGALGPGRIVTEHDVLPDAWYLDGDRAPVCISVEAGQADLFLSAFLGIDLRVEGKRAYRLLDAVVHFHRGLPRPGDTIRYDIRIDKFIRQGETYLFLFRFEGTIDDRPLITMENGCAGFFTPQEVENSGGIILTEEEQAPLTEPAVSDWRPPFPVGKESYDAAALEALRRGDLEAAFGPVFAGIELPPALRLPGGRMRLIHRVTDLDPAGGRYGLGVIRAEADIRPDDWFLTCHFVDDMVMPGTLMYECCAHTLRVFLQRLGWMSEADGVAYEPLLGQPAVLKCRGPVTPETRTVVYQVEISALGFDPEPFAVADAHMYADGRHIVMFRGMSLKLTGVDRTSIEAFWRSRRSETHSPAGDGDPPVRGTPVSGPGDVPPSESAPPLFRDLGPSPRDPSPFGPDHFHAYRLGNPSEAFGPRYAMFDRQRIIARLPAPPYAFLDRITYLEPEPWILEPGGWVEAEYHVPPDAWYFRADRNHAMPFSVLLEVALQPCGWLASYTGSPLTSERDLKFRNLDGKAVLHREVRPDAGRLTSRARLTKVSKAGGMLIESFDFEVWQEHAPVYTGTTTFGFFTMDALARQVGVRDVLPDLEAAAGLAPRFLGPWPLPDVPPRHPEDADLPPADGPALPSRALRMIDTVTHFDPAGGGTGAGLARAVKTVRPEDWFFKAHFHQDPVCPGSLGIESMLQLMKWIACRKWPDKTRNARFALLTGHPHQWKYRGQVLPSDTRTETCVAIADTVRHPGHVLTADGSLRVDGRTIYQMKGFGLCLA